MIKYVTMALVLVLVGCSKPTTVVETGYTLPPFGAVDYCKRNPTAKVCK